MDDPKSITAIGITEIVEGEDADTELGLWERALAHAEARARKIAAVSGLPLGEITAIEEELSSLAGRNQLVLRVTYGLHDSAARRGEDAPSVAEPEDGAESILQHVDIDVRPVYSEFRQRLLESEPNLRPAPAPLRTGRRRYEGFRLRSRSIIYASFRRGAVRLTFQLPEGHGLPGDEFVHSGRHDWRVILLSSRNQLEGALLLAQETVRRFA